MVDTNGAVKTLSIAPKAAGFGSSVNGGEGEAGFNFNYTAQVKADASEEEIKDLLKHTDQVAEIHNTLRKGLSINLQV